MSGAFVAADETMHPVDPDVWSWNESWFFSWIDLDGGPSGFFRVGVLPNQRRAMLWCFVHVDGEWLAIDESRLVLDDLGLGQGLAYDRWGLDFAWLPEPPLLGARFAFAGQFLARTGPRAGAVVPVSIDLACTATSACFGTATGDHRAEGTPFPASRFEQSLAATGTVVVNGERRAVSGGAHRDRSWGPREWRLPFALGDLQSPHGQVYFVGGGPGRGMGYVRRPEGEVLHLGWTDGEIDYDDVGRTIGSARLGLTGAGGVRVAVELSPLTPSVSFDMAHTCEVPENWLYWRTLVEARVDGWDAPCRGWFEANRYGFA